MNEKIIVLGHSGFLGREVYESFLKNGMEVCGFSTPQLNLVSRKECYDKLSGLLDENTSIVMLSAIDRKRRDDLYSMKDNVDMVFNLVDTVIKSKIKHLVYISSISVYGKDCERIIRENSKQNPDGFYGASKKCGEIILTQFCNAFQIPLTILRPGSIYGKDDKKSIIYKFMNEAISGNPIEIYGDGTHKVFPIHKKDLTNVIKSVLRGEKTGEYNAVIYENGISLLELTKIISKVCNKEIEVRFKKDPSLPADMHFNTSKFVNDFSDVKFTSLEEGLKEYSKQEMI